MFAWTKHSRFCKQL